MNLIFGEITVPVETIIGRTETVDGARRDIIELWTDAPIPQEAVDHIHSGEDFTNEDGAIYTNYNEVVRYTTWLAQNDPNAVLVQQAIAQKEAVEAEKVLVEEARDTAIGEKLEAVQAKETIQMATIPALLFGRKDDILIDVLEYIPEWTQTEYKVGDVRKYEDMPWICVMAHDATPHEDWTPGHAAMWAPYHAQSEEKALDWIAPTGAHDMYKAGEYMIFTDDKTYECLSDTNFSPVDLPTAWHDVAAGPTPDPEPEEPVDPEEPGAKNSNGTDIWSEWLAWDSYPATLYNAGDLVTHNGIRYISTQPGNHWEPGVYGWDVVPAE